MVSWFILKKSKQSVTAHFSSEIILNFSLPVPSRPKRLYPTRCIYNYKNVNWSDMEMKINTPNLEDRVIRVNNSKSVTLFDKESAKLRNERNSLQKRALNSENIEQWNTYKKIRNKMKNILRRKHKDFINNLGELTLRSKTLKDFGHT